MNSPAPDFNAEERRGLAQRYAEVLNPDGSVRSIDALLLARLEDTVMDLRLRLARLEALETDRSKGKFLKLPEASEICGFSVRVLKGLIASKQLEYVDIDGLRVTEFALQRCWARFVVSAGGGSPIGEGKCADPDSRPGVYRLPPAV